ncbi:MAG TPA: TIGR00153 family protein [Parachlamydiaceae bacterium]|nr:TIGR00153 family protein [Parachlamydiaceae bacterium]
MSIELIIDVVYAERNARISSMLSTILNLFGRSPFAPLQSHMNLVSKCVHQLFSLFEALEKKDYETVKKISDKISELENEADLTKNDIRNHLPKSLFLPIDRGTLLEILSLQDKIADRAEDAAILTTLKQIEMLPSFKEIFHEFLDKNIETFDHAKLIINEMHELLESSFGGQEAQKVRAMADEVAFKEHEADLIQQKLLKAVFGAEDEMSYSSFHLWQKIFEAVGSLANFSEKLANRVRLLLELK